MKRKLLLVSIMLALIGNAAGVFIGTAPGTQDLGTVERGETRTIKFYTTASGFGSDIKVEPSTFTPNSNFYSQSGDTYEFDPEEASQEDIQDWINFRKESFEVSQESRTVTIGGSRAKVNGEVSYFLDIPQSAEPGYHAVGVELNPEFESDGDGQQVSTRALSQYFLVFRVPGDAERDLSVRGVEAFRAGDREVRLDFNMRNTGTVTTEIRPSTGEDAFSLLDPESGAQLDDIVVNGETIAPGETQTVSTYWSSDEDIEAGNYRVRGTVDYLTGKAVFDDSFDVTSFIQIEPDEQQNDSGTGDTDESSADQSTSSLLVLMVLVALGVLMYSFEIDPLWIIAVVGFLGISSFVLLAGLPVYLIGIVLILTAAVFIVG